MTAPADWFPGDPLPPGAVVDRWDEGGDMETITTHTCVEVHCRTCGDEVWDNNDDMDGAPHWPNVEEAETRLTSEQWGSWLWDDDGPQCPTCVAKAICADEGHAWGDGWRTLPSGGLLRHCDRCPAFEGMPPLVGVTPVASGG